MGAHLPATAANVSNLRLSDKTFTYSITKGAILDVSLTGRLAGLAVGCLAWLVGGGGGCDPLHHPGRQPGRVADEWALSQPASCAAGRPCGVHAQPSRAAAARWRVSQLTRLRAAAARLAARRLPSPPPASTTSTGLNYNTDSAMNKSFYGGQVGGGCGRERPAGNGMQASPRRRNHAAGAASDARQQATRHSQSARAAARSLRHRPAGHAADDPGWRRGCARAHAGAVRSAGQGAAGPRVRCGSQGWVGWPPPALALGCLSPAAHVGASAAPESIPRTRQVLTEYYDSVEGAVSMDASVEHAARAGGEAAGTSAEGAAAGAAGPSGAAAAAAGTPAPAGDAGAGGTEDSEIRPEAAAAAAGGSGGAAGAAAAGEEQAGAA